MATPLTRRTVLLSGALAVVTAGGVAALSAVRESPRNTESLPVAPVPAPTDEPVEIVYCAGWDWAARAPVSPMSEAVARAQDTEGAQYAVVLFAGGVARAVVEVCWSAHHAELWNVDADGRRYRGVAYRRWPDGRLRLFEVRSWNYTEPGTPEFDGDEPTLQVRVYRDEHGAAESVQVKAEMSDGSGRQTTSRWPRWPERMRPQENVAVPADWPALAGMTGQVTVRPGPAAVPDRFPWRPPRPLQPRHVTELATAGARLATTDGRVLTVERVPVGTIRLPSGRLLVVDPGWIESDNTPLAARVAPGKYAVDVFQLTEDGAQNTMTAACRVAVTGAPVVSWELALRDGDNALALGDGEFFGNPVDTATLSLLDPVGLTAFPQSKVDDAMAAMDAAAHWHTVSDPETGTYLIIVLGWTDGAYPVWLGRAEDGAISCFVLDFMVPDLAD